MRTTLTYALLAAGLLASPARAATITDKTRETGVLTPSATVSPKLSVSPATAAPLVWRIRFSALAAEMNSTVVPPVCVQA